MKTAEEVLRGAYSVQAAIDLPDDVECQKWCVGMFMESSSHIIEAMKEYARYAIDEQLEIAASESVVEVVDHEELSSIARESGLLPVWGVDGDSIRHCTRVELI